MRLSIIAILVFAISISSFAQKKKKNDEKESTYFVKSSDLSTLKFRSIGPAMISGRIIDLAVNPNNNSEYYVAVASGGVFKTTNSGVIFTPIFDSQKSYSIGCISIDPNNSNVVWVGSGENNSQRSVSWGDGVYKSLDGGKSWKNMGLKSSEHIGKILIDPRNSDVIWVASQGPLWNQGGERGLYKSTDGGNNWTLSLEISENTGVSDIAFDPRNYDIVYATSYQRRRHVYTLINGGPEATIYKTTNGGSEWQKIEKGLPAGDKGRIGIAVSPANPDYVYAIVEAAEGKGGFYRSTNRGESWNKMSGFVSSSPQYYQELVADPKDKNCVYALETRSRYTLDGGKTFKILSLKSKHVDDHALWINPNNTNHLLNGGDGGLYESWDRGETWDYKGNLPLSQFYRVTADTDLPFYNVYGGTQDNNSVGGPSRTMNAHGIQNSDWFITQGGDGFKSQIDPTDPNTVYAQYQHGGIKRYNKSTQLGINIKPVEPDNGEAYRWNWDAPLIISPHNPKRLYFCANKVFKSDDRGNNWEVISPDLSQQLNRNELKIMGKIQSPEAVAKNASTSYYGNIVSIDESPIKQGLLFAGTDDGLIQISENDGANWTKYNTFPNIPENTYVSCIKASLHDENVVYASFENHKRGDFKPYILKSTDKGKSWNSIVNNLPEDAMVWNIALDHENEDMFFIGTEYGVYFTIDGGANWVQLKAGLPSIAIRDIDIQRRENDLILASYGRGFYILDDYSPLREIKKAIEEEKNYIFPIKQSLMYTPSHPNGWRDKGHFGDDYYLGDNPKYGAVFTYYIEESNKSLKQTRKKDEKEKLKNSEDIDYPTWDEFRAEDNELKAYILFTIRDDKGDIVRKLKAPIVKGMHRLTWDFRYSGVTGVYAGKNSNIANQGLGMPAMPGDYTLEMAKVIDEKITPFGNKQAFKVVSLYNNRLQADPEVHKYNLHIGEVAKEFSKLNGRINYQRKQIDIIIIAIKVNSDEPQIMVSKALEVKSSLDSLNMIINRDQAKRKRYAPAAPGLQGRMNGVIYSVWNSTEPATGTMRDNLDIVEKHNKTIAEVINANANTILELNKYLDEIGAPYTPGR